MTVLAQGGLNRNILTEVHDLQPLNAVELTHDFASGCAVRRRHRCPSSAWPKSHEHPVGSVLGSLGAIHDSREHARPSLPTSLCEQRDSAERSHEQEDQTESTERDTGSLLSELRDQPAHEKDEMSGAHARLELQEIIFTMNRCKHISNSPRKLKCLADQVHRRAAYFLPSRKRINRRASETWTSPGFWPMPSTG